MAKKVLSIVVPAFNEEDAIKSTIERMLEARGNIIRETDIDEVELIVVNDGSSDNTAKITGEFASSGEVQLLSFERNRGYGAAIKEGFSRAKGDYLGFFDADGTCDPNFFIKLYNVLKKEDAQISVGSRMHKDSSMPLVRTIGNSLYVRLINLLWRTRITDSASGMRLLDRKVLEEVYPLPDGLHFTPVMTCKALSCDGLKIVEIPMPYKERKGRSKLNVAKDGYRFLMTILELGFSYRPFAFFGTIGVFFIVVAAFYSVSVISHYARYRSISDEMIYRIIAVVAAVVVGSILFFVNLIMQDFIACIKNKKLTFEKSGNGALRRMTNPRNIILCGVVFLALSLAIGAGSLFEYIATGKISQHWIYTMACAFLLIEGTIIFIFGIAQNIIHVYKNKI